MSISAAKSGRDSEARNEDFLDADVDGCSPLLAAAIGRWLFAAHGGGHRSMPVRRPGGDHRTQMTLIAEEQDGRNHGLLDADCRRPRPI